MAFVSHSYDLPSNGRNFGMGYQVPQRTALHGVRSANLIRRKRPSRTSSSASMAVSSRRRDAASRGTVGTDDNQGGLMTIDAERPTPRSAVMAWWRSMQNKDVGAI